MVGSAGCCRKVVELPFKMVADNRNVVFMLRAGSREPELQAIALKVISLEVHMQCQIRVEAVWVPRELMSRLFT